MTGNEGAAANFLMTPQADELVEELAAADHLTIVVGAGAGMESGLPSWEKLVRRMLEAVARDEGLDEEQAKAFVDWTIQRDSLLGAAAIVEARLGDGAFEPALRDALYRDVTSPFPGPTALAAARLCMALGPDRVHLVTTNYDRLLERALETCLDAEDVEVPSVVDGAEPEGDYCVRHLHGVLDADGSSSGALVLSEAHYHRMQDRDSWQEDYFARRLGESTLLFVGSSLTDLNLLRYLYRSSEPGERHVACFARQQDWDLYVEADTALQRLREEAAQRRWEAVGIRSIHLDHFGDVAQLLAEVDLRVRTNHEYVPYRKRLPLWQQALETQRLPIDGADFRKRQRQLQELLANLLELLALQLHDRDDDERLTCSLWVYRPNDNALVNWASADRLWCDPDTLRPVPVEWDSDFAAVKALCNGSLVSERTDDQRVTRWNHVVGLPLHLDHAGRWGRLPAGVLTVASTAVKDTSCLVAGEQVLRDDIGRKLGSALAAVLEPA